MKGFLREEKCPVNDDLSLLDAPQEEDGGEKAGKEPGIDPHQPRQEAVEPSEDEELSYRP